jgi:serine/threonine-protein kinase RsbW
MSQPQEPGAGPDDRPRADVELRLPADGVYVSVVRTTTAGLAARLDFLIDDIEDLRIAVGEACAMVLPEADLESELVCSYFLSPGRLTVDVAVSASSPDGPEYDSFAWQVLSTMATRAEADASDGRFAVRLTMESGVPGASS